MITQSLTSHQNAIWLESRLFKDKPIFNIGTYIRLNGVPDFDLLQRSIQQVINSNDAMRIQMTQHIDRCEQLFKPERTFVLGFEDFSQHTNPELNAVEWMEQTFVKPISLSDDTLYHIVLVKVNEKCSYLFLKHHHIYIDGWSRALLVRKISQAYNAFALNQTFSDTSFFSTIIAEQNAEQEQVTKNEKAAIQEFWEQQFSDFNRTPLFDKVHPDQGGLPSQRHRLQLEQEVYSKFQLPNTPDSKARFYYLLSALYLTLSRATGKKEVVIGVPLLNRFNETELNTIGYFVSILPLRLSFEASITFEELAEGIRAKMWESLPYRDVSIQEINKVLGVNFSNSTQLYDVVFSFEPHNHDCSFGNAAVTNAGTFSSDFEQNALVMHVQNFNQEDFVNIEFDHNLNYISKTEVEILSQRFKNVIQHFVDPINQKREIAQVNVLFKDEWRTLLSYGEGKNVAVPPVNLVHIIKETVDRNPNKVAIRLENEALSYAELWNQANSLAQELKNQGAKPFDVIGIALPRSIDVIPSMVGILICGCAYVPMDSTQPEDRLQFILEETQMKMVVSTKEDFTLSTVPIIRVEEVTYQSIANDLYDKGIENLRSPEDLAYILFTSGTTGRPKGVQISDTGIINLVLGLQDEVYKDYSDTIRLGLLSSFLFDASVQHIYACLILGLELVVVPGPVRKDGKLLAQFLADEKIDVCDGIPSHMSTMLARVDEAPNDFNVQHFILGGESLDSGLVQKMFDWTGNNQLKISNVYGPTECTVDSTIYTLDHTIFTRNPAIPIGRPFQNLQAWVVDGNGVPVPPGVSGELYMAGHGLSTGYVGRPELTNTKFVHAAYLPIEDSKKVYKTGDQVCWNNNGELLFQGRVDHQVKVRGYRIELAEIEHAIARLPKVLQCAVVLQKGENQSSLIGCLRVEKGMGLDSDGIKEALKELLPGYMIPNHIHVMLEFPMTKTGKIDRRKLLDHVVRELDDARKSGRKPETETEIKLAEIWKDVLNLSDIDIEEGFFMQGGDSLSLVYLLAKIEKAFKVELSMTQFATKNSLKDTAEFIDNKDSIVREQVDWHAETNSIHSVLKKPSLPQNSERKKAFLTGVTGFVGAFILRELLEEFEQVYCHIRTESIEKGWDKLHKSLARFNISLTSEQQSQIELIPGDLGNPNLGITSKLFEVMSSEVDVIYHCGAVVNFMADYPAVKAANVGSVQTLLNLCTEGKRKQFNYVSTKGVFALTDGDFNEHSSLVDQVHYMDRGYEPGKWIAEGLIEKTRQVGRIDTNVFRLARITGTTTDGSARMDDFFHRFLRGCIILQCFPEEMKRLELDLTPVDLTAQSIVKLSGQHDSEIFHVVNHKKATYGRLVEVIKEEGINVEMVSYKEWMKRVDVLNDENQNNPLFLITPILRQQSWYANDKMQFRNEKTVGQMEKLELEWPSGELLWDTYVRNIRSKFPD